MIHHVSVGTHDQARFRRFCDGLLPTIGLAPMASDESGLGYGCGTMTFSVEVPVDGQPATVGNGVHVAFAAE